MSNLTHPLRVLFYTLILFLFSTANLSAQEIKQYFYQGTIDNRLIRLYLKQLPNNCGGSDIYEAIYQYGKGKNWIELLNQNNDKGNFCFTEIRFTGVLLLKKTDHHLDGIWISPDGKRQLKVLLSQQNINAKEIEELEERLERTHYENFDC
ncbi:hypothetical protein [Pedobacter aquatilis]|uniref:hypothetical protein n=1 Tax=Pedobacter aquatilis TaxID=351343 RepID=UPI0029314BC5|nr:hypothetical protein [Pedobacter aquatilis]